LPGLPSPSTDSFISLSSLSLSLAADVRTCMHKHARVCSRLVPTATATTMAGSAAAVCGEVQSLLERDFQKVAIPPLRNARHGRERKNRRTSR
jgi:hypothetical protein